MNELSTCIKFYILHTVYGVYNHSLLQNNVYNTIITLSPRLSPLGLISQQICKGGGLFCRSKNWSVRHSDFETISKLSSLMTYFLKAAQADQSSATVIGKQQRVVGLVVPAKYTTTTYCKRMVTNIVEKLIEKWDRYWDCK